MLSEEKMMIKMEKEDMEWSEEKKEERFMFIQDAIEVHKKVESSSVTHALNT